MNMLQIMVLYTIWIGIVCSLNLKRLMQALKIFWIVVLIALWNGRKMHLDYLDLKYCIYTLKCWIHLPGAYLRKIHRHNLLTSMLNIYNGNQQTQYQSFTPVRSNGRNPGYQDSGCKIAYRNSQRNCYSGKQNCINTRCSGGSGSQREPGYY